MAEQPTNPPGEQDDLYALKDDQPAQPPGPPPMAEPMTTLPPWAPRPRSVEPSAVSWGRVAVTVGLLLGLAAVGLYIWRGYGRFKDEAASSKAARQVSGTGSIHPLDLGEMDPLDAGLIRGQALLDEGRFQRALKVFQETMHGQPKENVGLRVGLARALLGLARLTEALNNADFAAGLNEGKDDPTVYAARADVLLAAGTPDRTLADSDKAIELGDTSPRAYMRRARCLAALHREGEADEQVAKVMADREEDAVLRLERAEVLFPYLARPADALKDLNYALRRAESLPLADRARAHRDRGLVLLAMDKPDQAVYDFKPALTTRDSDVEALLAYATCLARTDQVDEAIATLSRLLEISPDDDRAQTMRASLLPKQGRPDQAPAGPPAPATQPGD